MLNKMIIIFFIIILTIIICVKTNEIDYKEQAILSLNKGNDYYKSGDIDNSIIEYKKAIEYDNTFINAYSNLGNVLKDKGLYDESIEIHKKSIELNPTYYKLYYNIGVSYQLKMDYENAIIQYNYALKLNPDHVNSNYNLGLTYQEIGRLEDALSSYKKVLNIEPLNLSARLNWCNILMAVQSNLTEQCYLNVLQLNPNHVKGLINLASYYQSQIDFDNDKIINLYEKALEIEPNNIMATKALQALKGNHNEDSSLDSTYVRELFDSYSYIFEDSLSKLKYNSHELVAEAVKKYAHYLDSSDILQILDLGCGTGLACPPLRNVLKQGWSEIGLEGEEMKTQVSEIIITGIDISSKMLAIAKDKRCYNYTVTDNILNYVENDKNTYNIIIAADVFVYIGDLYNIFLASHQLKKTNTLFVFTVENGDKSDNKLNDFYIQSSGRYAHRKEYLINSAINTGWNVIDISEINGRLDKGQLINGYLIVLKS